jgi:hypothetical protein
MTTLGKSVFLILSVAALVAVTLAYRSESAVAPPARLTAAQLTEMQRPPPPPAKAAKPVAAGDDEPGRPQEPEFEDGNGS